MQRQIDTPPVEWLKAADAAKWLGISVNLYRILVRQKTFPPGVRAGHKTRLWHWSDVWAMSKILSWQDRTPAAEDEDDE